MDAAPASAGGRTGALRVELACQPIAARSIACSPRCLNDIDDFGYAGQVAGSCRANFQREIQAQSPETDGSAEPETIAAFARCQNEPRRGAPRAET